MKISYFIYSEKVQWLFILSKRKLMQLKCIDRYNSLYYNYIIFYVVLTTSNLRYLGFIT